MKQVLHIFKKDSEYLWKEICLVLVLVSALPWTANGPLSWWMEILVMIAAAYLIARVIHAEAIPGDNQFWLTRPYERNCLMGAKLLFIIVFVSLPIFMAQSLTLKAEGFPWFGSLPGLLWTQILMLLGLWLPVATLAALTPGIVPFIFSVLSLLALGFVIQEMMVPPSLPAVRVVLSPIQWVWDTMAIFFLVAIAVPVVYLQYKKRRTLFSRAFAIVVTILGAAAYLYVPWPAALAVETGMSKRPFAAASVHVALDLNSKASLTIDGNRREVSLHLPLDVTGVPQGVDVNAEALSISFHGPNGKSWQPGPYKFVAVAKSRSRPMAAAFDGHVLIDSAFYDEERSQTMTIAGAIFLSYFAQSRSKTIPVENEPVDATDGLRCSRGPFDLLVCRAPLRWPGYLIYAKLSETDLRPFEGGPISYSPFPAALEFNPSEQRNVSVPPSARQVTIIVKERLGTSRCDFEIPGIRLNELPKTR